MGWTVQNVLPPLSVLTAPVSPERNMGRYKRKNNNLLKNETVTGKTRVIFTRNKGAQSRRLPRNKENKMAGKGLSSRWRPLQTTPWSDRQRQNG